jgi:hypothetical protein
MKSLNCLKLFLISFIAVCSFAVCPVQAQQEKPGQSAENISYLDNGILRLGVDLNLGGSITYLAESSDGVNMINSHDWGRQIQMSFYSGPQPFTPNGNPIQNFWQPLDLKKTRAYTELISTGPELMFAYGRLNLRRNFTDILYAAAVHHPHSRRKTRLPEFPPTAWLGYL